MTSKLEEVFHIIDGARDAIIELEAELTSRVALGPENGGTGEHEKAAFLRCQLENLGPDFLQEIKAPDKEAQDGYRPNLVARWEGKNEGPTLWALSHMDIVPPGDPSLWEHDPYQIRVDGDRITGES